MAAAENTDGQTDERLSNLQVADHNHADDDVDFTGH